MSMVPQRFADNPGGTHYADCWRSHPECAYLLGRQDEKAATDEWTTRVAETSTDAATAAEELLAALVYVASVLGPSIPTHGCQGCEAEMGEALRTALDAIEKHSAGVTSAPG